jgi:Ca2+-transporting ATPase
MNQSVEVVKEIAVDPQGLTSAEAAARLARDGYNELPQSDSRNFFSTLLEVLREPMFILLILSSAIYFLIGDLQEAIFLLLSLLVIVAITIYQERKTEHALEALRDLSSPRALVIRDGKRLRIPGREVVHGDVVIVIEGDRVPADAALLHCSDLSVDESLLTGESVPVRKSIWDRVLAFKRPGGDDLPFVYSGTVVVQGQGVAQVFATGHNTEIGTIGKALQKIETEQTRLHKETGSIVRIFATIGLSLCALVVILLVLTRGNWLSGLLAGITLAMALIPEEFPVVLTVFLAIGAWRISRKRVLTRRVPAIETLGSATVLCVDKTGTLTQNRMRVSRFFANGEFFDTPARNGGDLPESFHEILEFSILASAKDPFDPMERAFKELGEQYLAHTEHIHADWNLVHEYGFSRKLLAVSNVWQRDHGSFVVAAKGAPEEIASLSRLDSAAMDALRPYVNAMASDGLRVLGVARASYDGSRLPDSPTEFAFQFLGLVALADPIRETVPASVEECYTAGIRVVMITGDYPVTAQSIARQIGLKEWEQFITGQELEMMDQAALKERVRTTNIFARVLPEQKLRIVEAFKANHEIVAMTGDGVNDAPALKAAHIGIAMGGRGTDVAREASSLVLLDDDFSSIVEAIRMGRRIFDNLRKAMAYIFAIHVPIAGMSLVPVIANWPLIFSPIHILFLELIIDPSCSIAFEAEPEEKDIMRKPPRDVDQPLLTRSTILLSLLQGISVLLILLAVYATALYRGLGEFDARTLAFTSLVIANLCLIFINRSWSQSILATLRRPNRALWTVVLSALGFLGLVLYSPFLRNLFRFSKLHPIDLFICFVAGIAGIVWFELLKSFRKKPRTV